MACRPEQAPGSSQGRAVQWHEGCVAVRQVPSRAAAYLRQQVLNQERVVRNAHTAIASESACTTRLLP